jgi:hypothetical protein
MSPLNFVGRQFITSIVMASYSRDFDLKQACKVKDIAFNKLTTLVKGASHDTSKGESTLWCKQKIVTI